VAFVEGSSTMWCLLKVLTLRHYSSTRVCIIPVTVRTDSAGGQHKVKFIVTVIRLSHKGTELSGTELSHKGYRALYTKSIQPCGTQLTQLPIQNKEYKVL